LRGLGGGFVSDQEAGHRASDKYQFRQERKKSNSGGDELIKIRIAHLPSGNDDAVPARRTSARAHVRPGVIK
jgi:hypothetical protein